MNPFTRRLAATYFVIQALGIAGWWCVLYAWPAMRPVFFGVDAPTRLAQVCVVADLPLLVAGSTLLGYALQAGRGWARPMLWFVFGAAAYAGLVAVGLAITCGAWLGVVMMLPVVGVPAWLTCEAWRR